MSRLRLLLNSQYSGANLFFALGEVDGSFRAAGLDLEMTPGRGAWSAASRLVQGEFDLAYGDINALAELAAKDIEADLPKAICVLHQHSPSVITVARGSPIRHAGDLPGRRIVGHSLDVALKTFPMFARAQELDPQSVAIQTAEGRMAELLHDMLEGRHDAVFGYATTHTAALASQGLVAGDTVRFLRFRESCPTLYGSALMASARLLREQPEQLRHLVSLLRRKLAETRDRTDAALDAMQQLAPTANRAIELARWQATMRDDMALDATAPRLWGRFDEPRLASAIGQLALDCNWPSAPAVTRVATLDFLTPN